MDLSGLDADAYLAGAGLADIDLLDLQKLGAANFVETNNTRHESDSFVLCPIENETPAHDGAYCITRMSFLFTNSWMPSSPVSRPYPDFLIPPKGMSSYV